MINKHLQVLSRDSKRSWKLYSRSSCCRWKLALQQPGLSLKTSLNYAIFYHRYEIIDRCLKEGYGDTSSLCHAARSMSIPMALYYLGKGELPNLSWGKRAEFPLYMVAKNGHISMLRLLLQKWCLS